MSGSNENNPHLVLIPIGDVAAGAATVLPGVSMPKKGRLRSVKIINNAALAGDDVNNAVIALKEGATTLASLTTNVLSGGLAQRVGSDLALVSGEEAREAGAELIVDISHGGTGGALTGALLQLEMYPF